MWARSGNVSKRQRANPGGLALVWLCACPAALAVSMPQATQPVLLAVRLNGQEVGDFVPLLREGARYYARAEDLRAWRLAASGRPRVEQGVNYYPLPERTRLDAATQTLEVELPASAFTAQRIDLRQSAWTGRETPAAPGLALDYDLNLQTGSGRPQAAALLELGAFGLPGVPGTLRHREVLRNSVGQTRALRLDTQWRIEEPDALRAWTLGDTVTCVGELGGAARFAGFQVATDFGLRPDLVTHPLPALAGSASVPSAIDLLVDGRSAGGAQVGSGPFQLDNPPLVSGAGEITVVQQDVLGRSTQVSVPYYVSPRLLHPRLSDYCLEAGKLRRNYGVTSADYGAAFTAAGGRLGVLPTLTLLGRIEMSAVSNLYLGANWVAGQAGVVTAQLAGSRFENGGGGYGQLRFERQARKLSFAAGVEGATRDYRRLSGDALPQWRASVAGGLPLGRGSLSLAAVWQRDRDQAEATRIVSAGLSARLALGWQGQLTVQNRDGDATAFVTLSHAFDPLGNIALAAQAQNGDTLTIAQAQRGEPLEGGLGWQLYASEGVRARQQAGLSWLGQGGRFSVEAANERGTDSQALRLGGRGGLLWLGGVPVVSRGLGEGAIARVSLPGLAGVPVLHQNRVVAVTDANGDAWVPNLLPHQPNAIAVDAQALPLAVRLDREAVSVRPPGRAAVTVVFPLERSRTALLRVLDEAGTPLPAGARARVGEIEAPFGLAGEVFLERLATHNRVDVRWADRRCTVVFDLPASADPQPRIGPLICRPET